MGLASKFFLATSAVIVLCLVVAGWSLLVVSHLVDVNRAIATHTVPAVRLETSLREPLGRLFQFEARHFVLREPRYGALWSARAEEIAQNLQQLGGYLTTEEEHRQYRKLMGAFTVYRRSVTASLGAAKRPDAAVRESATAGARIQRSLSRLLDLTSVGAERARIAAIELERRTWNAVLLALLACICAAVLAVWLLSHRVTRVLRRLAEASARVAEGSFRVGVEVRRRDELGDLARAFNRMAERLGEVDRLKQEFFSHISHELRTPLTSVREAVRLLGEGVAGRLESKQARLVEIIDTGTDRVLRLVNRILELSRVHAGLLPLDRRWVDVGPLVDRTFKGLLPQAEAGGLVLDRNGAGRGVMVLVDAERLLEVLENLVGNAIKFTPAGGRVRVRVAERRDHVDIVVEDTGMGIPEGELATIFDPYRQARGARGGTGLGLAIVRGIVEAHGGRVRAESREGQGSRFTVSLPGRGAAR